MNSSTYRTGVLALIASVCFSAAAGVTASPSFPQEPHAVAVFNVEVRVARVDTVESQSPLAVTISAVTGSSASVGSHTAVPYVRECSPERCASATVNVGTSVTLKPSVKGDTANVQLSLDSVELVAMETFRVKEGVMAEAPTTQARFVTVQPQLKVGETFVYDLSPATQVRVTLNSLSD